jgi:pimeloyl-ACP methyl ester carboxylesterase
MQVIVNSLLTEYSTYGKGPIIVCVHGWADSSKTWSRLVPGLSKRYRVITLDLPGFGGTQQPLEPWKLEDYAAFIERFLAKLNVSSIHALVTHSNGGAITINGLATGKLSADKLVLIASAGVRNQDLGKKKALRYVTKVGKLLTRPLPNHARKTLRGKFYKSVGSDMLIAEHMQETFKYIVTEDVQEYAEQLHIPTILLYGTNDTATPVSYGQLLHKLIPNSQLEIIQNGGHFIHQDQSGTVLKYLESFIK